MLDDLNVHGGQDDAIARRARQTPPKTQRMADREVPIGLERTPARVQEWLDGDASEAAVRQVGGEAVRHVEFWNRINAEVEQRRHLRTPVHVQQAIMDALPRSAPRAPESWWQRKVAVTPATMIAGAAGLMAVGAVLGAAISTR
jgi:hypothetical protein